MKPAAENIPTRNTLWEEICRVNALLERRIAEQMFAAWQAGRLSVNATISGNPNLRQTPGDNAPPGAGTGQPA